MGRIQEIATTGPGQTALGHTGLAGHLSELRDSAGGEPSEGRSVGICSHGWNSSGHTHGGARQRCLNAL